MSRTEDLIRMKEQIDEANGELKELEGRKKEVMSRLKKDYKISTLEALEKKIKALRSKADKLDDKISTGIEELEEAYEWED